MLLARCSGMTDLIRLRRLAIGALITGALVTGCGKKSDDANMQHRADGDTGAAAPATQRDMSATPGVPDSTTGVSSPTGTAAPAGDTLGAKGKKKP